MFGYQQQQFGQFQQQQHLQQQQQHQQWVQQQHMQYPVNHQIPYQMPPQRWPTPPPPPPRTPPPPAQPPPQVQAPSSVIKAYKPYFSPLEIANLLAKMHMAAPGITPVRMNEHSERLRSAALGYIDRVGARLGFPRRTIGTAQYLYSRFHLFFSVKDFKYEQVCQACCLVSCKLEDTLKKTRDIQIAGHQLKSILEGGKGTGEPDPATLENDRTRLIGIERLILETICFNFYSEFTSSGFFGGEGEIGRDIFGWVLRFGKLLGASKDYTRFSFLLAIDVYRTFVPLSYPPHTIAISCLWLAQFLGHWEDCKISWPTTADGWEQKWEVEVIDVEEISHQVLDLFISLSLHMRSGSSSVRVSPSENSIVPVPSISNPMDPTNPLSLHYSHVLYFLSSSSLLSTTDFTQIKIKLRQIAAERPPPSQPRFKDNDRWIGDDLKNGVSSGGDWLGRDDVTVRFRFREAPKEFEEGEEEEEV